jgi:hypothetical protein
MPGARASPTSGRRCPASQALGVVARDVRGDAGQLLPGHVGRVRLVARVDADPELERIVPARKRVADRQRRPDGALRVVVVRHRRAEDGHHRVADELLDRAAVALELAAEPLVVRPQDRLDVLRIELVSAAR